jgi:hypothetical protein
MSNHNILGVFIFEYLNITPLLNKELDINIWKIEFHKIKNPRKWCLMENYEISCPQT